ncbi:MAG: phosphoribosyltransferase [Syntrophales bacterium]|jgi:predicted phosphoribosyltransferase|nr:phosphoribosyltransferase [Syntrophales bacterium]MDY0044654.1 phosphoribosyltransferase [Syntrophales bacterium]
MGRKANRVEQSTFFRDRKDAGRRLAAELFEYKNKKNVLVLALPRGGVPVGYEIARYLSAPLDVFLVRKLGVPGQEELAMGAVASGGIRVLNEDIIRALGIHTYQIDEIAAKEQTELERREQQYRGNKPDLEIKGRTVILVDDGLATGASMRAAVKALKLSMPSEIIVAVPTASPDTCEEFKSEVDKIICAETPSPFRAVGARYVDFSQTTDEEVRRLLKSAEEIGRLQ